jgi:hypothetical protein
MSAFAGAVGTSEAGLSRYCALRCKHMFALASEAHPHVRFRRAIERRACGLLRTPPASCRISRSRTPCSSPISTPSADRRSSRRRRCAGSSGTGCRRLAEAPALRGDHCEPCGACAARSFTTSPSYLRIEEREFEVRGLNQRREREANLRGAYLRSPAASRGPIRVWG